MSAAVAVAVCTTGASPHLPGVMATVRTMIGAGELLLVHSGTGPVPRSVADLASRLVQEPRPGISRARQVALTCAAADVVAFLDDDAVPLEGWLEALVEPLTTSGIGMTAGVIEPVWPDGAPPGWVPRSLLSAFGSRDAGSGAAPFGANMAVRRAEALAAGGFEPTLGHLGSRPGLHEEEELSRRLREAGLRTVDVAGAVVRHHVRRDQLTLRWVCRRAWAEGRSDRRLDDLRGAATVPRHVMKGAGLLAAGLPSAAAVLVGRPEVPVHVATRLLVNLAYVLPQTRSVSPNVAYQAAKPLGP